MKKLQVILLASSITVLLAFTGCIQITVQGGSSGSSSSTSTTSASSTASSSSSSTSSSSSSTTSSSTTSSSTASSSKSSSSSSSTQSQGTPRIEMGNLNLLNVHETSTGVGADAVVQVVNTSNVPLVLSAPSIQIANESGTTIVNEAGNGIFTGPSYLRAGDVGFIYTTGPVPLPSGYFPGYDYKVSGTAEVTACKEVYEYPVSNLSISDGGDGAPMVSGTVTNDDTETADLVELSVAYLDNDGALMGVASDIVVNLAPGESKDFTIDGYTLPVSCTIAIVSDYDVIAVAPKF